MKYKYLLLSFISALFVSCGGGFLSKNADVVKTQKPTLLLLPSDQLLSDNSSLRKEESLGKSVYVRDYNSYLLNDDYAKSVISAVQNAFIEFGYPLNDLEQTLKSINNQNMIDAVSEIKKDSKTLLLTAVKPDIILEYDYDIRVDMSSRKYAKKLSYTIRAIDSYTNKVIATIQKDGLKVRENKDVASVLNDNINSKSSKFTNQIDSYFNDIVENGRDITVRILIDQNEPFSMSDNNIYGTTYSDYIIDYMKENTFDGAYKLQMNTDSELYFVNVRIRTLYENNQYSAYDFARDLSRDLDKECGVKSKNVTQGLGDAVIIIKGM